jgi:hypothetical protein
LYTLFKSVDINSSNLLLITIQREKAAVLNGSKRVGLYGATGILIAIVIIAGFIVGGLYLHPAKATLTIQIMDAPVALDHLNLTIDWVRIQRSNDTWYNLTLETAPFYFDLLTLQNVSETLSVTQVPAGNCTMIWMHVLTANATYPDGTTVDLKVLLKPHLILEAGSAVTVLIDIQPDDLNSIAVSHSLNLRPVIKAIVP